MAMGMGSTYNAITRGLLVDPTVKPAFDIKSVQALFNKERYTETRAFPFVIVSVDPAAGGSLSDYTIVSAVYCGSNLIVRTPPTHHHKNRREW